MEEAHCFWCGEKTASPDYVINPGGTPVIKCCCESCFSSAEGFVEKDARARKPFYIILFVLAALNVISIGVSAPSVWSYLPLLGLAMAVVVWPSLFTHYSFYSRLGLVKTRRTFRLLAAAIGVLAAFSMASCL